MRLALRPSPQSAVVVLGVHAAALMCAATYLPPIAAVPATVGLMLSAWHEARHALQHAATAVAGLDLRADGSLAVAGPDGGWQEATVRAAGAFGSWLAILTLRDAVGRRRVAMVHPGVTDAEHFRRLRVWTAWCRPQTAGVDRARTTINHAAD